jgi:coenzyme F420-reducing hydrogenase delta subunit
VPCKWHPLTAMENAVKDGFTYDAEAVVLPVKCTGLVKVSYLLKLFAKGVRGVLVLGCDEGDCRYYNGSARCAEIVDETREILDLAGVARDRLQFHMIAESGGREVKRVLKGFFKQLGKVSPARAKRNGSGKAGRGGKVAKPAKAAAKAKKATQPKPARAKAGKQETKPAKQAGGAKKATGAKKSAGSRKATGGTRTVKARKGTKRESSRRHK